MTFHPILGIILNQPFSSTYMYIPGHNRYTSQLSTYFEITDSVNPWSDDIWPKLLYSSISGSSLTDHVCSSYCLLDEKHCQFFYTAPDGNNCYLGSYMFETDGGFIPSTSDANVQVRNNLYLTFSLSKIDWYS